MNIAMERYLLVPKEDPAARGAVDARTISLHMTSREIADRYVGMAHTDPLFSNLGRELRKISYKPMRGDAVNVEVLGPDKIYSPSTRLWGQIPKTPVNVQILEYPGVSIVDLPRQALGEFKEKTSNRFFLFDMQASFSLFLPILHPEEKETLTQTDLWHLEKINLEAARRKGILGTGKGIRVGVIDTGINSQHPELGGRVVKAYAHDASLLPLGLDLFGHGTMVSSLICGKQIGSAPDADIIDLAMMTRPNAGANLGDFFMGLVLASKEDVAIVNISGGLNYESDEGRFRGFMNQFPKLVYVVAAGNDGPGKVLCPGSLKEVITVGAVDRNKKVWHKSGGKRKTSADATDSYCVPDLVAPGVDVAVAERGGKYKLADGTSMATPIISGVLAAMLEKLSNKYNQITPQNLMDALYANCLDLGAPPERQGKGMLAL